MSTGLETEKGLSTHATPVVPLFCLAGVVLLLSSVTPVIKYVFQHSHLHPIGLASFRVTIGFLFLLLDEPRQVPAAKKPCLWRAPPCGRSSGVTECQSEGAG